MDVTFQRLGGNRYFANAARADGVTVRVPGYDRTSAVPHDLAHFVAEREFGVTRGFWGSVAAGALFTNMVVVSGRQKPHAAERSKQIIKAHADDLGMSEALAGAVHDAVEQDLTLDEVMKRLRAYWGITSAAPLPVAAADAEPAINALRHAAERWAAVAVDEGLTLTWPLPVEKVSLPRTGRSQRSRRGR